MPVLRPYNPRVRGPIAVDWSNPITRGITFAHHLGKPGFTAYCGALIQLSRNYVAGAGSMVSPNGELGMGGSANGDYWGGYSASNTFALNQNEGTVLSYVRPSFTPTDGLAHYIAKHGGAGASVLELLKFSDNSWYFGWNTSGTDTRLVTAATGTFSQNQSFTVGGTWNKTSGLVGTKFYTKGILRASSGTTPSTGVNTTGFSVGLGVTSTWIKAAGDIIYSYFVWNRALTPDEILSFESNPWQIFYSPVGRLHDKVKSTAAAAGFKARVYYDLKRRF